MPRKPAATTTLNIRGIDAGAARSVKAAAQARGMTIGAYVQRLALLHLAAREWAEHDERVARELATLGLSTITA